MWNVMVIEAKWAMGMFYTLLEAGSYPEAAPLSPVYTQLPASGKVLRISFYQNFIKLNKDTLVMSMFWT